MLVVVAQYMKNSTPLSNVRFVPYKKQSNSNAWEKSQVGNCLLFVLQDYINLLNCSQAWKSGLKKFHSYVLVVFSSRVDLLEVKDHWMDLHGASPNQGSVFMHMKGPGLHFYAPTSRGGMKYMCAPEVECKLHERYFQQNTTTALF